MESPLKTQLLFDNLKRAYEQAKPFLQNIDTICDNFPAWQNKMEKQVSQCMKKHKCKKIDAIPILLSEMNLATDDIDEAMDSIALFSLLTDKDVQNIENEAVRIGLTLDLNSTKTSN